MMKISIIPVVMIPICLLLMLVGCSDNGGGVTSIPVKQAVSIEKKTGYYAVTMDYSGLTRKEVGRLLALEIQRTVPNYEALMDAMLKAQLDLMKAMEPEMKKYFPNYAAIDFPGALKRAQAILKNVPTEYADEIQGMRDVFSYGTDTPGDGRFSANELLVVQLFTDVLRPWGCSASAAFGSSSATGKTVLGRNLDWFSGSMTISSNLHAATTMKNGTKSSCNVGMLGLLFAGSQFNSSKVFGALLDAENRTLAYPADVTAKRSYAFDLRYALDNFATLQDVADFMKGKDYAFNHLIFLADENTAGVLENNIGSPGRGLRTAASPLQTAPAWNYPNAVATVNDFRLVGNYYAGNDISNISRWDSYLNLYKTTLSGVKVDLDTMKGIAGYYGTDGNDENGAVFLSSTDPAHYSTNQSIILRMDTLEMWVHFAPAGGPFPLKPTYLRVNHALE